MDVRDIISLPEPDFSILANVKDSRQRELIKGTLESQDYRLVELGRRNRELQDENRRLQSLDAVAQRARADADKVAPVRSLNPRLHRAANRALLGAFASRWLLRTWLSHSER